MRRSTPLVDGSTGAAGVARATKHVSSVAVKPFDFFSRNFLKCLSSTVGRAGRNARTTQRVEYSFIASCHS